MPRRYAVKACGRRSASRKVPTACTACLLMRYASVEQRTIHSCAASLLSLPGAESARWFVLLRTRPESAACVPPCREFGPSVYVRTPCSCPQVFLATWLFPDKSARYCSGIPISSQSRCFREQNRPAQGNIGGAHDLRADSHGASVNGLGGIAPTSSLQRLPLTGRSRTDSL